MPYPRDANVFIQAKNLRDGLDFCPAFWDWQQFLRVREGPHSGKTTAGVGPVPSRPWRCTIYSCGR
jgi:hypothetical protein